jgi:hypothetical protein
MSRLKKKKKKQRGRFNLNWNELRSGQKEGEIGMALGKLRALNMATLKEQEIK